MPLTRRQQEVLDFIAAQVERHGSAPTREEIATAFGFRSPYAAECHIKALEQKGAIRRLPGKSRGIRVVAPMSTMSVLPGRAGDVQREIPLIGRVAAGAPILAAEHVEQQFQIDPGLFRRFPDYLLRVRGDSMQGIGILDGDLLAVRRAEDARNGQIVVARIDEDVTVKRFERFPERILLHAENPAYAPIEVRADAHRTFAIEGLAVGVLRDFSSI